MSKKEKKQELMGLLVMILLFFMKFREENIQISNSRDVKTSSL